MQTHQRRKASFRKIPSHEGKTLRSLLSGLPAPPADGSIQEIQHQESCVCVPGSPCAQPGHGSSLHTDENQPSFPQQENIIHHSINLFYYAYIIYNTPHHPPDVFHHSASCRHGCIAINPNILPFRIYVRSCQLHPLGSQRLVPVDGASSVPLPSPVGFVAGIRGSLLPLLSVPPGLGCIGHHILLHGLHCSVALSQKAPSLLSDAHSPGNRLPPPSYSWHLPPHPLRPRLHLCQGREFHPQSQHPKNIGGKSKSSKQEQHIIKFKSQSSKFKSRTAYHKVQSSKFKVQSK